MEELKSQFGFITNNKVILKGWSHHPDRGIGVVRDNEEVSLKYFEDRFKEFSLKIEKIILKIQSSSNKGSYLQKIIHLRNSLSSHDGLGDYMRLDEMLKQQEQELKQIIEKNRQRNSMQKQELLEELNDAIDLVNWKEATEKILEIKRRWIGTGNAVPGLNEKLNESFWEKYQSFFERKKSFLEDKKNLAQDRSKNYQSIINETLELKNLARSDKLIAIDVLRDKWMNIGNIPQQDYKHLHDEFKNAINKTLNVKGNDGRLQEIEALVTDPKISRLSRKELEDIRDELFALPKFSFENKIRKKCVLVVQLILEEKFLESLCKKKIKNFSDQKQLTQKDLKIDLLKGLISRDQQELQIFLDNMENISIKDQNSKELILYKLKQQKMKIETKNVLLKKLEVG